MTVSIVTGGAGFVGSHLCEKLLGLGHYVICVDNYYCSSTVNISHLRDNPRFELIRHDITWPIYLEADEIYNLACPASPVHYQRDPVQTLKTCVHGTINCLGMAKRLKAKFLQASTSEVYGNPLVHPQPESYWGNVNPVGQRSCYDEGKRAAETLVNDYRRQYDLDTKIIRIFNTFGPRMQINDGRVVSNFITQALTGKNITLYGTGDQTRSFCYVDDLVEGMILLMKSAKDVSGPINVGNPHEITIRQLAEEVIELTGSTSSIVYAKLPSDDPLQRQPDIDLAKSILGWQPDTNRIDGIKRTIDYFRTVL